MSTSTRSSRSICESKKATGGSVPRSPHAAGGACRRKRGFAPGGQGAGRVQSGRRARQCSVRFGVEHDQRRGEIGGLQAASRWLEYDVVLEHVYKTYPGRRPGGHRFQRRAEARRICRHARAVRLRQDDNTAHDRRSRGSDRREDLHRREGRDRPAAGAARHLDDVPELRAVSPSHGFSERRVQPEDEGHGKERARPARLGNA